MSIVSRYTATRAAIADAKTSGAWSSWNISRELAEKIDKEYAAVFAKPKERKAKA